MKEMLLKIITFLNIIKKRLLKFDENLDLNPINEILKFYKITCFNLIKFELKLDLKKCLKLDKTLFCINFIK